MPIRPYTRLGIWIFLAIVCCWALDNQKQCLIQNLGWVLKKGRTLELKLHFTILLKKVQILFHIHFGTIAGQ